VLPDRSSLVRSTELNAAIAPPLNAAELPVKPLAAIVAAGPVSPE
jgi:hypothetical protein